MGISGTSDIIKNVTSLQLDSTEKVQVLEFLDGKLLILAKDAIALHKSRTSFEDPLADSYLGYTELAPEHHLHWIDGIIEEYKSGYVGLKDQRVILITPNAIQLFPGKKEALHNQQCIAKIALN
ncbi:hypothetical protein [Neptunomonas antarctica]|uniref:Uncharacterized protein n=1 Tax=Neptunomonas antarctica TaxID=619304 RepID=A0A1N7P3U3_9GAMM|nr:hypothetical protein [Neptunomonas antarctica]SIT05197.1 hypothetical protein SAMN05421760_11297 [Neptunomonas antarctica]